MSDNIKVVVKVRPLILRETEDGQSYQWRVKNNSLCQLDQNGRDGACFTFDRVYDKDTKTCDIYNEIAKPIVEAATAGFNGTIFAYGQTSSGKTYTMSGTEDSPGIIPLAVCNLFQIIKNIPDRDFLVRVSYIEIYNETLKDLLNLEKEIKIRPEYFGQGVKVECTEVVTTTPDEVLKYLKQGEANRQTGATNMNEVSSRSHSIFQITIESRDHIEGEEEVGCVNVSTLNLVDLAGSERAGQTGATGKRFIEGTHINKSLSTLALVIKQLSEDQSKYINYRDSKLTRILQNSLGGNAKTSIICAVTPAAIEETISTLQFANRAKAIKNKPEVIAVATDATMIQSLTKKLSKLQSQLESKKNLEVMLESKKNVEQDNYNLQKQIATLQKMILNGFVQRSNMDMVVGARRKLVPPRRVTIHESTLHVIEEDPVLPKFHTPLLKYNPALIPGNFELNPSQNSNKLTRVSEERENLLITPPPQDKIVNFNAEIIELDSDDDSNSSELQLCSPYHKCRGSSKTPPCVLRKNAKLAEKNLKDIVELTEREKLYSPDVVDLLEKLEENTSITAKLQEEMALLHNKCKEKDLEIDKLKVKVTKSMEEINSINSTKTELEKVCEEYTTKLTDWEVSYETLKRKTKQREEELLSLLEERRLHATIVKIDEDKPLPRNFEKELNFLDISKDVSLVNSDNETSTINSNDYESTPNFQDLVTDLQNQLTAKNEIILELEKDILSQKQTIATLEVSSKNLQHTVDKLSNDMAQLENDETSLKSTIEILNSTIKSQKDSLESAHTDIESYNSLIQELQIKIANKEKVINVAINETTLENMIANEEKFIANNENMKNIITSLKLAIDSRNREIESLKSTLSSLSNSDSTEQLKIKEEEINKLHSNTKILQKQLNEKSATIDELMQEKVKLTQTEQNLNSKLSYFVEDNKMLKKLNEEANIDFITLKENYTKLSNIISEKDNVEADILKLNEDLNRRNEELNARISSLENDIHSKDKIILSLKKEDSMLQKHISNEKLGFQILLNILVNLNVVDFIYDDINDIDTFAISNNTLRTLETKITEVLSKNQFELENSIQLRQHLERSNESLTVKLSELQSELSLLSENKKDNNKNEQLLQEIRRQHEELENNFELKNEEIHSLQLELRQIREENQTLHNDNLVQKHTISSLYEKESKLIAQVETMSLESNKTNIELVQLSEKLKADLENSTKLISQKDTIIFELKESLNKISNELDENVSEVQILSNRIKEIIENENTRVSNILYEITTLYESLYSDSDVNVNTNIYETIFRRLEKIATWIYNINSKNCEDTSILSKKLVEAEKEITDLKEENKKMLEFMNSTESVNSKLLSDIELIRLENKDLNKDLLDGNETLEHLRNSLKSKTTDLDTMVAKAQALKEDFSVLDNVTKEELKQLTEENERLKIKCFELETVKNGKPNDTISEKEDIEVDFIPTSETKTPPTLLTLCCNHIINTIQPSEVSVSTTNSDSSIDHSNVCSASSCNHKALLMDVKSAHAENVRLSKLLELLEKANQELIAEQEQVRREVQLLLEPAHELQKKINTHKTHLSTLTATTHAENMSLKSQVKVLQHYHSRFHNVCQKDLPVVRKQLCELLSLLKCENSYYSDKHNASFKRFSLPCILDNNSTINTLKNDSTLDGDLLMLDTNITLATSADITLIGSDQAGLDITQIYANNDVACQTNLDDYSEVLNTVTNNAAGLNESKSSYEIVNNLDEKNELQDPIHEYSGIHISRMDAQTSPLKIHSNECDCQNIISQNELLSQELREMKSVKEDIEKKYNNAVVEQCLDSTGRKLEKLEGELKLKVQEILTLTNIFNAKTLQLKLLQEENDSLSTQIIENVTEIDDLNKELDDIKQANLRLSDKCIQLEELLKKEEQTKMDANLTSSTCSQCLQKDNDIKTLQDVDLHLKLNRSLSDSDTSSRYNKICTLQSELHAGREDCRELTEDVTTIKNQLEQNNLSIGQNMDLDESMGESNIFTFSKNIEPVDSQINRFNMSTIQHDRQFDGYTLDKNECLNYYLEKTGTDKENLSSNVNIIDLMKMFHNNLLTKHSNQVENLVNKIKCYEDSRIKLETHVNDISNEYSLLKKVLEEKENHIKIITDTLHEIKQNINPISEEYLNLDIGNTNILSNFKENILEVLDNKFDLTLVRTFENVIKSLGTKHQNDLTSIREEYTKLQEHMKSITDELNMVKDNLLQMKTQLSVKENEYNLLKTQKERVHEISNAVTLDIIRKEQELYETIVQGCKKLIEHDIIRCSDFNITLPLNKNIHLMFERIISEYKPNISEEEKESLILEIKKSKSEVDKHKKALEISNVENETYRERNITIAQNLKDIESKWQSHLTSHEELQKTYEMKIKENKTILCKIEEMKDDLNKLKDNLILKENIISTLEAEQNNKIAELVEKNEKIDELLKIINDNKDDINKLKSIRELVAKEKDVCAMELEECKKKLEANKRALDKMTFDVITLNESVNESVATIDNLKLEVNNLSKQNMELKNQVDDKNRDCCRLEMNIKTHEKTAEIQSRMIIRLQKQKEEDDKVISDKSAQIQSLTQQYADLQTECELLKTNIKTVKEDLENLRNAKESLRIHGSELESDSGAVHNVRPSLDPTVDSSRRRRRSVHDAMRMVADDCGDHNKIEALFDTRPKPHDLFMDVDEDGSNRSTPHRNSRGRDSLSRHDQTDREEEHSRPSSVMASRLRRQSIHDLHRTGVRQTPSPHERSSSRQSNSSRSNDVDNSMNSELTQLRERLSSCRNELEELKERYAELDEECETCSQYLKERDAQCLRLKKEKAALENTIVELKDKLQSINPNRSQQEPKRTFSEAFTNTDEDWTNLHSVVVDRMSFDAEVEKNKRLTKTVEELRFKKQELKNTIAKMQKALEKSASRDYSKELEATRSELKVCKQELKDLKEKYKEMDQEYETCAQYLHERDDQCRRLKESKAILEAKLQEHLEIISTQSQRKKRQSIHDQNRCPVADVSDAATMTSDDILCNQVERDNDTHSKEVDCLRKTVEKLSRQKASLEEKLAASSASTPSAMYIATGSAIVQNQQITDVLKENQRLKKMNAKLVQICKKRGKDLEKSEPT